MGIYSWAEINIARTIMYIPYITDGRVKKLLYPIKLEWKMNIKLIKSYWLQNYLFLTIIIKNLILKNPICLMRPIISIYTIDFK